MIKSRRQCCEAYHSEIADELEVDLAFLDEDLTYQQLSQIEIELDDLDLPYTIDVARYQTIRNEESKKHIREKGVTFYKRKRRSILNQEIFLRKLRFDT